MTNGVDINFFTPSKSDETLREKLGLSKNTIVFYGLIENWLDFKTVLEGLKIVKKDIPDAKLLVIGSTLTNYTKVLEKMLQDTDLANDVILTGYIPNELVPYYINLGDMCIMPYKIDNFSGKIRLPIKFFIYSSMGKPILSVALPEVKRFNPDHVFFYDNPEKFASHARKILKSKQLKNDLGHYARDFAKDFDFSKLAKDCETVIQQLKQ
jgi:glycosyltransferase involved in cell wall biosynthesis